MSKKRSRIRQTKTEWQKAFEAYNNIQPQSWHFCLPELLHVSIALIDNDFEKVKSDFIVFCYEINKIKNTNDFYGNLSATIEFVKKNRDDFDKLKGNVFYFSIKQILIFYNVFNIDSIEKSEYKPGYIIKGFHNIIERRSDTTIICKFIFINNVYKNDTSPLRTIISSKEEVLDSYNRSLINSAWLVISSSKNLIDYAFTDFIWNYNYVLIPVEQMDDTLKEELRFKEFKINELKDEYLKYANEFRQIQLFTVMNRPIAEIIMGFVNRAIYLTNEVVELVEIHKGEIAEAVLRMLYESRLKFLWLLKKEDIELFQRFREFSSGREKLFYERLIQIGDKEDEQQSKIMSGYKQELDNKLNQEGLSAYEIATERGDEFEIGIDKMADEIGKDERYLYDFVYKRTSDIVHGNWRIIEKYHLVRSENPMHDRLLYYNLNKNKFSGLLPAFIALMFGSEVIYRLMEDFPDIFKEKEVLSDNLKAFNEKIKVLFNEKYFPSINSKE